MLFPVVVSPCEAAPTNPGPKRSRPKRRAATSIEYVALATFILVALILGVQHLRSITSGVLQNDADSIQNATGGP